MEGYDEATYGERVADVYDDWFGRLGDLDACVTRLHRLASDAATSRSGGGDGSPPVVFELGIGTGRIALPLASMGADVRGVDSSPAMLERLAAKPGADVVAFARGDMASCPVPRRVSDRAGESVAVDLAFVAYNTLFNLPGVDAQRRCFRHVADLLAPTGRFAVEAFVPDLDSARDNSVTVRTLAADRLVLSATLLDESTRTISGQYVELVEGAPVRLRPWELHYLAVAELDELADQAGLVLEHRWADYDGTPFDDATSAVHVSVYRPR